MKVITEIFNCIIENTLRKKESNIPLVVGITGIDTSGKSEFANRFRDYLHERGYSVQILHIDDFHNKRVKRYSGVDEVDNYYNKSFDIKRLVADILKPIKENGELNGVYRFLNLNSDEFDIEKKIDINKDTIVILEGVFILKDSIRKYIDYNIFLNISFSQCKLRAQERDVPLYGANILKKYDQKYIPTQKYYIKEYPPKEYADLIIDNTDYNNPEIIY